MELFPSTITLFELYENEEYAALKVIPRSEGYIGATD